MAQHRFLLSSLWLLLAFSSLSLADLFPDCDHYPPMFRHDRARRFVRVHSRKPHPDALPEFGIGFQGHLKNLLKGGSMGLEFQIPHVDRLGRKFPHWNNVVDLLDKKGVDKKANPGSDKDYEMLERGDYGDLINPRVKKQEP